ncbi:MULTISPECIES: hypothetical protein [unclassified Paenibacillus]|uniref:hypothetical protein n=1 Tax=unclassified Paenibacillus TaxID=185978 RepID=UPI000954DE9C|nr:MULTISPECIES: hypothetical protein [unclassified Paenibacillus]QID16096.1 hypothetical protein CIC07_25570 [Paenibacillus sp. RUD330]SIP94697.1 hypothetical protein SAMN05880555_0067 [Paenibacillus sp. RU4X]SIQ13137.1 hypothetical protein SAMN05880570_0067 [Paenibacillus sp. RU4T]
MSESKQKNPAMDRELEKAEKAVRGNANAHFHYRLGRAALGYPVRATTLLLITGVAAYFLFR